MKQRLNFKNMEAGKGGGWNKEKFILAQKADY